MQIIEVDNILDIGLSNESDLNENEKLIYAVAYLESVSDMEGWDHFFTYSMKLYPLLCRALKLASDLSSLSVIRDYEKHLESLGVDFKAQEIDCFLATATDEYLSTCPDWREQFSDLSEQRWVLIARYFQSIGVQLKT